jgi:hypothetical protein
MADRHQVTVWAGTNLGAGLYQELPAGQITQGTSSNVTFLHPGPAGFFRLQTRPR